MYNIAQGIAYQAVSVARTALSDGDVGQVIEARWVGWVEHDVVFLGTFVAEQRSTWLRRRRRR